jgi:epoxyqueuosine reductase
MSKNSEKLTLETKEFARHHGADLVKIASASVLNNKAPVGHRPQDYLPDAKSVVVIAMRMFDPALDGLPDKRPLYTENFHFTSEELNICANKIGRFLLKEGFQSQPIFYTRLYVKPSEREEEPDLNSPSLFDEMSFKHAAVESGMGKFGLNRLLLTPEYGPRVRLLMVLTSAELLTDKKIERELCIPEECGYRCVTACPPHALKRNWSVEMGDQLDKIACHKYMFIDIAPFRCGLCVSTCPIGQESRGGEAI